jgi:flavorubredoxin
MRLIRGKGGGIGGWMRFGVLVHSQSGNTARLALAVTHSLREKGHDVSVELLRPIGKVRLMSKQLEFRNLPDIASCDVVLIGGPVWAYNASPVVTAALQHIRGLERKRVLFFLTSFLPNSISGSGRAHARVGKLFANAHAITLEGYSLSWGVWCGKKRFSAAVEKIRDTVLSISSNK